MCDNSKKVSYLYWYLEQGVKKGENEIWKLEEMLINLHNSLLYSKHGRVTQCLNCLYLYVKILYINFRQ